MGFWVPKKTSLAPKPKKLRQFFEIVDSMNWNRPSTNISNLVSRDTSTHGGETKRSRRICRRGLLWSRAGIRSIFGNACACKLPVMHILQCRSRQALSLRTVKPLFVRLPLCAAFSIREPLWKDRDLYLRAFLWAPRLVFLGYAQWNISIVVLYISLPLCMGRSDISFQENFLSHEYLAPRWWWLLLLLSKVVYYPWLRVYVAQIHVDLSFRVSDGIEPTT